MRSARSSFRPPFLKRVWSDPSRSEGRTGYPFDLPLFRALDLSFERPATILIGDNGTGKSTLLEAIAELAGFPAAGGSRAHRDAGAEDDQRLETTVASIDPDGTRLRSLRQMRDDPRLTSALRAAWLPKTTDGFFFRAESFFHVARYLDEASLYGKFGPTGDGPLHLKRSHAEGFLDFFRDRLDRAERGGRPALFVLDEPESALAVRRQVEFLALLQRATSRGRAQVIMATHSPILMAMPGADLWQIHRGGIEPTRVEDSEPFRSMRSFVDDPHGFVARGVARAEGREEE